MHNFRPHFFTAVVFCMLVSCNDRKKLQTPYSFYYYPDQNLYYSVSKSTYFYSLDGGNSWDSSKTQTVGDPEVPSKKVTLTSSTHDIWKDNINHRRLNNGTLLDFSASIDTLDPLEDVSEKKVEAVRKKETKKYESSKPKKRNLLDKIFGKNKGAK